MFIRTRGNYRDVFKSIVGLKKECYIKLLTLFNTGGMDLLGARDLSFAKRKTRRHKLLMS